MSHTESDLIQAARELRELIEADTYPQTSVDKGRLARLRDLLHSAAGVIKSMAEQAREREARIGRLESSNGSLMVDRDRTNSRAATEVAAARELVVKHLGIDGDELDKRLREQAEYDRRTLAHLDAERTALDTFRTTVVQAMFEVGNCITLDAEQLAALRKVIDRANKRALGR